MTLIPAALLFAIAQNRRKKGIYNLKTLKYFQETHENSRTPKHLVAFAKFERDLLGTLSPATLKNLEGISQKQKTVYRQQASRLLLEKLPSLSHLKPVDIDINHKTILQKQNQWRRELFLWLEKKSIAVVGNGVSLKYSNLGKSIDSNAIICRFNTFPMTMDAHVDIGKRTDLWIVSPDIATSSPVPQTNIKWIIVTGGDVRFTLQNWQWSERHLKNGRKIITIPLAIWSQLVQQLEAPPSAGVLWLSYLLSNQNLKIDFNLYGFDRHINKSSSYHFATTKLKPSSRHAWEKERLYLDQLNSKPNVTRHFGKRFGVFTKGLLKNDSLKRHLSSYEFVIKPEAQLASELDGIIGWGRKKNTIAAQSFASKHKTDYFTIEDGFIHSMSQGRLGAQSWSLIKDSTGVFYDATTASDLETLINRKKLNPSEETRAKHCMNKLTHNYITKYNNANLLLPSYLKDIKQAVLVIDQVEGDTSIPYAFAKHSTFNEMLEAALTENPHSNIVLKIHPDVINGQRKGCVTADLYSHPRVVLVAQNINPLVLMQIVEKVYVVSSQMGFEALVMDKEVVCFGVPFYAGWGLTDDRTPSLVHQRRTNKPDILSLFHCAYIDYSSYIHPETKESCEIEDILNYIALQNHYYRINSGLWLCIGLAPWKRQFIKHYLKSHDNEVHFIRHASQADSLGCDDKTKLLIWSSRFEQVAKTIQKKYNNRLTKVEDGFIRSIGLGVNYSLPSSLVFDKTGIYFDPNQTSDIENLLANHQFDNDTLEQARLLIKLIISSKVTKYNIATSSDGPHILNSEQHTILIPGQVANDASIKLGCRDISDNLSLIKLVRKENKSARILYKPHPDVMSGRRSGAIDNKLVLRYCDEVIDHMSISDCLGQVDEVHTLTSLVGFEALLRGITVYCYGLPFYAGWGLTNDKFELERRCRELSIEELVAAVLLIYPRYYNWENKEFTTPDSVVTNLSQSVTTSHHNNPMPEYVPEKMQLLMHLCSAFIKAR